MRHSHRLSVGVIFLLSASVSVVVSAAEPQPGAATEDAKGQARGRYTEGVALLKRAQWSEALAAFEAAAKLYPNASITLAMGACERALGRYVRARATLARALSENTAAGNVLPESSVTEAQGFLAEIDHILAHVTLTVDPPEAAIAVDGRPLAAQTAAAGATRPLVAAGVLAPGPGSLPPAKTFDLVLDPGAHVITLSRKGFKDEVVNKTLDPGSVSTLDLTLTLIPATLKISSTQAGALVHVNDADIGPAPVDVLRPAGSYQVTVNKAGFLPYGTQITVQAGEEVKLSAPLLVDKPSIAKKWWFWTLIAAGVAAVVVPTVVATRPKAQPPPYDTGTTGWLVPAAIHF